jgi:hypothetical protein
MSSWDRQPGESEIAYAAFKAYLALDGKRSGHEVARRLSKRPSLINRWAKFKRWNDRARDYDSNREKELLATEITEEKKRLREVTSHEHKIGSYFEGIIRKALSRLNERFESDPEFLMSPKDIAAMAALGFELQKTEFQDHADEKSGRRGISALAESINALAQKTLEEHEPKQRKKGRPRS